MGRMKNIAEHLSLILGAKNGGYSKISGNMFSLEDIEDCKPDKYVGFAIKFRGLNGIVPLHFFTSCGKDKIDLWMSKNNSDLGRTLRGER
jgi:hypothetical protein